MMDDLNNHCSQCGRLSHSGDCFPSIPGLSVAEKPPLGIMPRAQWEDYTRWQRIEELIDAIKRYKEVRKPVPHEWIEELRTI